MSFERVVSLTPSLTETVFALGAEEWIVGVTDACDYPPEVKAKPHVCPWFAPDKDRLEELRPDLVLGLASAHACLVPFLMEEQIRYVLFDPQTIREVLDDIVRLGDLLAVSATARSLVEELEHRLARLDASVQKIDPAQRRTVSRVLDYDNNRLIVAGPRSFQYDVIKRAGGLNVTSTLDEAYPKVSFQQFEQWDAEVVFLCGTDAGSLARLKADPKWRTLTAVRHDRLYQFDCGLTCRTSPRIVAMAELLFRTLYGEED